MFKMLPTDRPRQGAKSFLGKAPVKNAWRTGSRARRSPGKGTTPNPRDVVQGSSAGVDDMSGSVHFDLKFGIAVFLLGGNVSCSRGGEVLTRG